MSLRWRERRADLFRSTAAEAATAGPAGKRGELRRDFAAPRRRARRPLAVVPLAVAALISVLALASLRISILRARYALGATLQRETELLDRERTAAAAARGARDPQKLRELAAQLGFGRPGRVVDLSDEARAR